LKHKLDYKVGYKKYEQKNKNTDNSRNGYSSKKEKSNYGKLDIQIPRDREGGFEPSVVKKNQPDISSI